MNDFRNIEKLSVSEKYILAFYTFYCMEGSNLRKINEVLPKLQNTRGLDLKAISQSLSEAFFLDRTEYNWRTGTYDYKIYSSILLGTMLYFYEKERAILDEIDNVADGLQRTVLQSLLWMYIDSGFSECSKLHTAIFDTGDMADVLIHNVSDSRFVAFFRGMWWDTAFVVLNKIVNNTVNHLLEMDCDAFAELVTSFPEAKESEQRLLLRKVDFYNYIMNGRKPEKLLENAHHYAIVAIQEAYGGNYEKAYRLFVQAQLLYKKEIGARGRKTVTFPFEVENFFFMLVCHLAGTTESKMTAMGLYNAKDPTALTSACALYEMFHGDYDDEMMDTRLRGMLMYSQNVANCQLGFLMSYYLTGYAENDEEETSCLILMQELRKYKPVVDEKLVAAMDAAYGPTGLLSRIYRKQKWEKVLDELMAKPAAPTVKKLEKTSRIAYFLPPKANYVEVKLQTVLRNGNWSAGKAVAIYRFAEGSVLEMDEADRRIAKKAVADSGGYYYYVDSIKLRYVLPEMVEESRLYYGKQSPYTLMTVNEVPPYITLTRTNTGFDVTSNVPVSSINEGVIITRRTSDSIEFVQLSEEQQTFYSRLLTLKSFPLEAEEQLKAFLEQLGGKIEVNSDLIEGGSTMPSVDGTSQLTMKIRPAEYGYYEVDLSVHPYEAGRMTVDPGKGDATIVDRDADGKYVRVIRDMKSERKNRKEFVEGTFLEELKSQTKATIDADQLLPAIEYAQQHTDTVSCEWLEGKRIKVTRQTGTWGGSITKNSNGWFEIEGSVQLDQDNIVSMAQLLDLVSQSKGNYIKLGDGEFLAISEKLRKQLDQLNAIASRSHGKLQLSPFSAALLGQDVISGDLTLEQDEELKQIRSRIKEASTYTPQVPETLNATLRNYQKEGFLWMARLNKWGAGALLADDMGLGKTIQTITFLLHKADEGPSLVVAPASVAPNWKIELEKFAPTLNVMILNYADDRSVTIKQATAGDVVVTTYGLLLSVKDDITEKHWTTICLDEAHIIKNRGAKTSAVAMDLKSDNRVMLTGTPVQNHLGELWNLFQFVNPGLLGPFEDFKRRFITPIEQNGDKVMQHELDRLVKPFMLRRTKDKVAKELPQKEEIYRHIDLSKEEMLVYEVMRRKAEAMLLKEQGKKVSMNTLAEITRLRQCSCDCRLVEEGKKVAKKKCGSKITALVELLQTMIDGFEVDKEGKLKGGVLVFSQFTSYLALIREALDKENIPYLYIDGTINIKKRQKLVDEFQNGICPVFLISLKAGGLGLNLTRANYVIHTDPWWNPAIEAQATDRAHRIGQQQSVTVYHLIAEGTIEEKIQRLHEKKQALVQDVLESTDMSHKLTGDDLLEMVSGGK